MPDTCTAISLILVLTLPALVTGFWVGFSAKVTITFLRAKKDTNA